MKARVWRFLMSIGLFIHKLARPRPPRPTFTRRLHSTLSDASGSFDITVYTPSSYNRHRISNFKSVRGGRGYPCLVNFHGGGFTLGTSTDDARWVDAAMQKLECVVISVDYRLGPESPFPTAVDDGADAVLWIAEHADELGIDPLAIALTGFSSGANLVLTVPVRLYDHARGLSRELYIQNPTGGDDDSLSSEPQTSRKKVPRSAKQAKSLLAPLPITPSVTTLSTELPSASASTVALQRTDTPMAESIPLRSSTPFKAHDSSPTTNTASTTSVICPPPDLPDFRIVALAPFYPPTDYTRTRAVRRATNPNPKVDLPPALTALFDDSYLHPISMLRMENAYLSPGAMGGEEMRSVYGDQRIAPTTAKGKGGSTDAQEGSASSPAIAMRVVGVACEWDMLASEGAEFARKLRHARKGASVEAGGDVVHPAREAGVQDALDAVGDHQGVSWVVVKGVPHGWDKRPFLSDHARKGIQKEYEVVCRKLAEAFEQTTAGGLAVPVI